MKFLKSLKFESLSITIACAAFYIIYVMVINNLEGGLFIASPFVERALKENEEFFNALLWLYIFIPLLIFISFVLHYEENSLKSFIILNAVSILLSILFVYNYAPGDGSTKGLILIAMVVLGCTYSLISCKVSFISRWCFLKKKRKFNVDFTPAMKWINIFLLLVFTVYSVTLFQVYEKHKEGVVAAQKFSKR